MNKSLLSKMEHAGRTTGTKRSFLNTTLFEVLIVSIKTKFSFSNTNSNVLNQKLLEKIKHIKVLEKDYWNVLKRLLRKMVLIK
jgi:hypothetical protein